MSAIIRTKRFASPPSTSSAAAGVLGLRVSANRSSHESACRLRIFVNSVRGRSGCSKAINRFKPFSVKLRVSTFLRCVSSHSSGRLRLPSAARCTSLLSSRSRRVSRSADVLGLPATARRTSASASPHSSSSVSASQAVCRATASRTRQSSEMLRVCSVMLSAAGLPAQSRSASGVPI